MNFDRHNYVASSEYDNAFRALCGEVEFIDDTVGDVETSQGHLTLLTINMDNIESASALLMESGDPIPSQGFYIVHENNLGILVAFAYDEEDDRGEDWADEVDSIKEDVE